MCEKLYHDRNIKLLASGCVVIIISRYKVPVFREAIYRRKNSGAYALSSTIFKYIHTVVIKSKKHQKTAPKQ